MGVQVHHTPALCFSMLITLAVCQDLSLYISTKGFKFFFCVGRDVSLCCVQIVFAVGKRSGSLEHGLQLADKAYS